MKRTIKTDLSSNANDEKDFILMGILQEMTSTYNTFTYIRIQFFRDHILWFVILFK